MSMEVTFPQYRKFAHERNYFKITSDKRFEELQFVGDKFALHVVEATILPEFNYVADLLAGTHWVATTEAEWEEKLHFARTRLQQL